jgi:hypothetical protein
MMQPLITLHINTTEANYVHYESQQRLGAVKTMIYCAKTD